MSRRAALRFLIALAVVLAVTASFERKSHITYAASLTVTTLDDELNSDGDCSLREAITAANSDAAVDACIAGSGADTIAVPAGVYTLTLGGAGENAAATGDLDISDDLTIQGAGLSQTIIQGCDDTATPGCNGIDRIFEVTSGVSVSFQDLTIRKGYAQGGNGGGGIFTSSYPALSTVFLTNVQVRDNIAEPAGLPDGGGGIFAANTNMTITNGIISNNRTGTPSQSGFGGGLIVYRTNLTIQNSIISNNWSTGYATGGEGGAMYIVANDVSQSINIINSTVSGNHSGGTGGIYGYGYQSIYLNIVGSTFTGNYTEGYAGDSGAIDQGAPGTINIFNTTISGNTGGHFGAGGVHTGFCGACGSVAVTVNIANSTIVDNDNQTNSLGTAVGGVWQQTGTVNISNSIISGNTNASGTVVSECAGGTSQGYNIFGQDNSAGGCPSNGTTDIVPIAGAMLADFLNPALVNNGGPTQTHLPVNPGLAVGTGSNALIPADIADMNGNSNTTETSPYDQRGVGFPRVNGVSVDIGAVEAYLLPGVTMSGYPPNLTVGEDGTTDTYTIALDSVPSAPVVITSTPDANCQINGGGPGVAVTNTFSDTTPLTLTVSTLDNAVNDGNRTCTITHSATSGDSGYNGISIGNIVVDVLDDDATGITVTPTSGLLTTEAGGTATFTIRLTSMPAGGADVTIPLSSSDTGEGTVPASVTILNANWNTGVVVTVTGVDDTLDDGDQPYTIITGDPTSADPLYDALSAADVGATNQDNDTTGITVTPINGLLTTEVGGTATFTITLASQPAGGADVTVPLSSSNPAEGTVSALVTILNANWNVGVVVTVTGVDDTLDDGDQIYTIITGDPASGDPIYNALSATDVADVNVTNQDNDTTGITVVPASGLITTEAGGTATFTILLNLPPAGNADVSIPLSSANPAEGTVPALVTILNANWNTGVVVTITGQDDLMVDGDIAYTIITGDPTSADPLYDALAAANVTDVSVSNQDNDSIPVADDDAYTTNEGQTLTIDTANGVLNGDTGGNGTPLQAVLDSSPASGTLTVFDADGSFEYTPNAGFFGTDTFTYHATDNTNASLSATVTITVSLINGRLTANDDFADTGSGTSVSIDVLENDIDPEGDPLHISGVPQPAHGQVAIQNGWIVYTPTPGFVGTDTFSYTAADSFGGSDTATVTVVVWQPVPLCADFDGSTNEIVRADVPAGTVTSGSAFCRILVENSVFVRESAEVGQPEVLDRGVIQAVDVFALRHDGSSTTIFKNTITVCLQGEGAFLFLDATTAPRAVIELPIFRQNGYTCASVPSAGTVVLVSGAANIVNPAPEFSSAAGPAIALADCSVTSRDILNLHAEPDVSSAVTQMIPYNVTMTAFERTGGWFYVDYLGARGWVSAGYVTPQGTCGQ